MEIHVSLFLIVLFGLTQGEVELSPEKDALQYVFGDDAERHQGVWHLHWHEEHLKAVAAILRRLNKNKQMHLHKSYPNTFDNLDEQWKMYDAMLHNSIWGQETGMRWDTFDGDRHVLYKIRRYISLEDYRAYVKRHISEWGNDYPKYYAMDPYLNYTIQDADAFAEAMLTFTDPADLRAKIGMTEEQLKKYADGFRNALLLNTAHIEFPMLLLELMQEMASLGLIDRMYMPQHPDGSS